MDTNENVSNVAVSPRRGSNGKSGANIALWILQVLLALLFAFAGVMKLMMPVESLADQANLPGALMQAVSACEVLGALGLVVPGVMGRWRFLTPLAAAGLVLIMVGAVVMTIMSTGPAMALFPFAVGVLCLMVAYARRDWR